MGFGNHLVYLQEIHPAFNIVFLDTGRTSKYIDGIGFGVLELNFLKVEFNPANVY